MGKYSPFKNYLEKLDQDEVLLSFSVIEDLIDGKLPESAYKKRQWWENEKNGRHVQAHSWLKAGWKTKTVDFNKKTVKLIKIKSETPFLNDLFDRVEFERELVYKFFTVFSLFEYALKNTGFLKSGERAQPDWDEFARNIDSNFNANESPELQGAVKYMLSRPVKKQIQLDGVLDFVENKKYSQINNTQWLSLLIRGTRNNLFHGGKFRYDHPRDTDLINNSLVILENWAKINHNVYRVLKEIN